METFAIRYNPRNVVITKLIDAISHIRGVERIYPDDEFTFNDLKEIEEARQSGVCTDITQLENLLMSN